jgi:hypothetical protein
MVGGAELVGVYAKGDRRIGVPELPRNMNHVRTIRDQDACKRVSQVMEGRFPASTAFGVHARAFSRVVEAASLNLPMLERLTERVREQAVARIGRRTGARASDQVEREGAWPLCFPSL